MTGRRRGFGPPGNRPLVESRRSAKARADELVERVRATFAEDYAPQFTETEWLVEEDGFRHPELGRVSQGGFYPYGHLYIQGWFVSPKTDRGVEGPFYPLGPLPTPEDAARLLAKRRREIQYGSSVMFPGYRWEQLPALVWRIQDHARVEREHHLRRWRIPGDGEVAEWGGRFLGHRPGLPWLGPFHGAAAVEAYLEDVRDPVRVARWWRVDPESGDPRHPDTHAVVSAPELLR